MTRGLKRLGAAAAKPRRGKQPPPRAAQAAPLPEAERLQAQAAFERLTEASSALMDSGELDVYSKDKVLVLLTPSSVPSVSTSGASQHMLP